jgi:maleylacetoacetate isomerase
MIRLFDYFRSSASYRVRIGLNLKGLVYERVDVSLLDGQQREADNLARNPQGFVPTLEVDGHQLTQSLAILDYLDARFPEPPFVSRDPARRSKTLAQALLIACDIHPLNNLRVLNYLKRELGASDESRDDWYRHWVRQGFVALERMAEDSGTYLGGDAPDLADICLVPQMFNARRFKLDLTPFPTLVRIDAELQRLDAFAAASPERIQPAS